MRGHMRAGESRGGGKSETALLEWTPAGCTDRAQPPPLPDVRQRMGGKPDLLAICLQPSEKIALIRVE